jgi:ribosome biogenesis GTPase A
MIHFFRYFKGNSGEPNQSKVAKILLRDLVKGKLLLCKLPSGYEGKNINITNKLSVIVQYQLDEVSKFEECKEVDINFFQPK